MSTRKKRILRVGASGVLALVIDLSFLLVLVEGLRLAVPLAAFIAAIAGALASFLINKFWAFRDASPLRLAQVASFAFVAGGSALAVATSLHLFIVLLGMHYLLAKAMAAALVFGGWSYPLQSRVVFPRRGQPSSM